MALVGKSQTIRQIRLPNSSNFLPAKLSCYTAIQITYVSLYVNNYYIANYCKTVMAWIFSVKWVIDIYLISISPDCLSCHVYMTG